MKKQAAYLSFISFLLAFAFFGQLVTAKASEPFQDELIPNPTPVCEFNTNLVENGEDFYFSDDGKCLKGPVAVSQSEGEDRIPTSIKLVSTGTEIRDPISTAGIFVTFLILIALTVFWLGTIKKWNRQPDF